MSDDRPTFPEGPDEGEPLPVAKTTGEPCKQCKRLGRRCHAHPGDEADARPGGRPHLFTEDRRQEALQAARRGTTKKGCARAAGISYETLRGWLAQGREDVDSGEETGFSGFFVAFTRARSRAEQALIARTHEQRPWWLLERSYGYHKRTELTGEDGDPIEVASYPIIQALQEGRDAAMDNDGNGGGDASPSD